MPFVSKLVRQGTRLDNYYGPPYTTWSVASIYAFQCGVPLLVNQFERGIQGDQHLKLKSSCLGDFLNASGIKLYSYLTNVFISNFKQHLSSHKYQVFDRKEHGFRLDYDLVDYLTETVFPKLAQSNERFVLHFANTDNHPPYYVDKRCIDRNVSINDKVFKCYDCLDQNIERLFQGFEKAGLHKNTEVILYGDHILMSVPFNFMMKSNNMNTNNRERAPIFILPYSNKAVIEKRTSIYDAAPTILDILGIEYSPRFPFGDSIFSKNVGFVPSENDYMIILNTTDPGNASIGNCNNKIGFCSETIN